jgi:lipoyl(octanoyl) transferase
MDQTPFTTIDLGLTPYTQALDIQRHHLEEVLAFRESGAREVGRLLLVEHPPVITLSNRPTSATNLVATPATLAAAGVEVQPTDRGGDITYHGPGQLVAYPIFDLNRLSLRIHEHMRMLETAVISTCSQFGVHAVRDPAATGVWVNNPSNASAPSAKVCAMGVRVRRWVSMHGLAINVTTNLDHFNLIIPCGLAGRPVTSLQRILGDRCPTMPEVKAALINSLASEINARIAT